MRVSTETEIVVDDVERQHRDHVVLVEVPLDAQVRHDADIEPATHAPRNMQTRQRSASRCRTRDHVSASVVVWRGDRRNRATQGQVCAI